MFTPQQPQIRVQNLIQAQIGDQVILGIKENALLLATVLLYGVPLLTLISGILVGQWLSLHNMAIEMELSSLLGGLFGLSIGFGLARHYSTKAACQVIILRRSTAPVIVPVPKTIRADTK
jgi:sigma-E factor negative regulatory protein RseC